MPPCTLAAKHHSLVACTKDCPRERCVHLRAEEHCEYVVRSAPELVPIHLVKIEWLKCHEDVVSEEKILSLLAATRKWDAYLEPLLVDLRSGAILDGHHRYTVGLRLKLKQLPVVLVDYLADTSITVEIWPGSKLSPMSKQDVIHMALSPHVFPPKSTKHRYTTPLGFIHVPLSTLSKVPTYHGMYSTHTARRHARKNISVA
jgi:hypothetical protein